MQTRSRSAIGAGPPPLPVTPQKSAGRSNATPTKSRSRSSPSKSSSPPSKKRSCQSLEDRHGKALVFKRKKTAEGDGPGDDFYDHMLSHEHLNFLCSCPSNYQLCAQVEQQIALAKSPSRKKKHELKLEIFQERDKPCSGRDELCNEVLNDDWASHPTWASEDSGFIAHRKNTYEEGLHKIEEERHDYDFNIEACGRTIQLLEPIAQQMRRMSNKEREQLEIPAGIGGQSETIHKRVIMKLYGRERGQEVIEALHATPYKVIPILLNRLKQKYEEWKGAQVGELTSLCKIH